MTVVKIPGLEYDEDIIITGDLHAQWRELNQLIARRRPTIVLQCGDFGWWPKWHRTTFINSGVYRYNSYGIRVQTPWNQHGMRAGDAKLYFCAGNHEDWETLTTLTKPTEVHRNIFYMPRCSVLNLPDGRNVLFMGGALSTDKEFLTPGMDWFPEETIKNYDVDNLPDEHIDIVISHTCPIEFKHSVLELVLKKTDEVWKLSDSYWLEKFRDPSCYILSHVLEKYEPSLWFFGHFHINVHDIYRKTRWFALNKQPVPGWWTYLPTGEVNE